MTDEYITLEEVVVSAQSMKDYLENPNSYYSIIVPNDAQLIEVIERLKVKIAQENEFNFQQHIKHLNKKKGSVIATFLYY